MRSPGVIFAAAGTLIAVPVVVVAVLGGGASGSSTVDAADLGLLRPGSVPAKYLGLIQAAGSRCTAAPAPIIAAQLKQESGFDPHAVSAAGAEGIAQFLPATWKTLGGSWHEPVRSDRGDPGAGAL